MISLDQIARRLPTELVPKRLTSASLLAAISQLKVERNNAVVEAEDFSRGAAAEAYQVIGAIAYDQQIFDNPNIQRALDYFSDTADGERGSRVKDDILPFSL